MSVPNSTVMDIATMHKIRIVEMKGAFREGLQKKHPFYINITIPGGTYKGINQDVETLGFASCLFTHKNIPAENVYKMTKALYEHSDEIAQIHQAGKWIKLETAKKGIFIPFHEGAARYFKEKGIK
jgi:TRAP transporter TAXI family solute receptor